MSVYNPITGKYYELKPYNKTRKKHKIKNLWKEPKTKKSMWDIVDEVEK